MLMENRTTELRAEYTDQIDRTVVAFANTEGGKIYIGIDSDGTVLGVESMVAVMRKITNMIRDAVRPDVSAFTECTLETIGGRLVVVLTVNRGTARPYYLADKGIRPEGVFLRMGASSVPASETAILNMIRGTGGERYENARSVEQQLTFRKTEGYFAKAELPFDDEQKRALNIIGADGTYTNLAMLLSEQCLHTLRLAVFEGTQKSDAREKAELTGSLLAQWEAAFAYLDRLSNAPAPPAASAPSASPPPPQDGSPAYPREALREALLNAVLHRDYSFGGPTLISIFQDRIELVTVGGLPHGLTFQDIKLGVSALRNQDLARVFLRLGLIEAYGSGIQKINDCYRDCPAKPRLEVSENAFKLTLPHWTRHAPDPVPDPAPSAMRDHPAPPAEPQREEQRPSPHAPDNRSDNRPDNHKAAARQERLLRLAEKQGYLVRKNVETHLRVSQATAILILREMVEKGLLIKEGSGKHQKYRKGNPNSAL